MAGELTGAAGLPEAQPSDAARRPGQNTWLAAIVRWLFITLSLSFLAAVLLAPLATVFAMALARGFEAYLVSFADPDTLAAIRLTLLTAAVVVPINTVFGLAAAWAIAKFEFRGKSVLITLIDLPLAISPVISGMVFLLLFGLHGWFGVWLQRHDHGRGRQGEADRRERVGVGENARVSREPLAEGHGEHRRERREQHRGEEGE